MTPPAPCQSQHAPRCESSAGTEPQRAEAPRAPEPMAEPVQRSLPPLLGAIAARSACRRCAIRAPRPGAARSAGPGPVRSPLGPAGATSSAALAPPQRPGEGAAAIQQSIARIHEASQAPTLSPPDYRTLFDVMAQEIGANGLGRSQTLVNIVKRAQEMGIEIRRDDVRFVLDVVSEADPWFDAGRVARACLPAASATSWSRAAAARVSTFRPTSSISSRLGSPRRPRRSATPRQPPTAAMPARQPQQARDQPQAQPAQAVDTELRADRWWNHGGRPAAGPEPRQ